jgi:hypothetical protein
MSRRLYTPEDIAAAGAKAVKGWTLSDGQRDRLTVLLAPYVGRSAKPTAPGTPIQKPNGPTGPPPRPTVGVA